VPEHCTLIISGEKKGTGKQGLKLEEAVMTPELLYTKLLTQIFSPHKYSIATYIHCSFNCPLQTHTHISTELKTIFTAKQKNAPSIFPSYIPRYQFTKFCLAWRFVSQWTTFALHGCSTVFRSACFLAVQNGSYFMKTLDAFLHFVSIYRTLSVAGTLHAYESQHPQPLGGR
jgi:hypothetical protein